MRVPSSGTGSCTVFGMEAAGQGVDISVEPDCQDKHFHLCDLEHIPNVFVPWFPHRCYCTDRSYSSGLTGLHTRYLA